MVTGWIAQKRRYRHYKARTKQLPPDYGEAIAALERYLMYFGAIAKGEVLLSMVEDLLDECRDVHFSSLLRGALRAVR